MNKPLVGASIWLFWRGQKKTKDWILICNVVIREGLKCIRNTWKKESLQCSSSIAEGDIQIGEEERGSFCLCTPYHWYLPLEYFVPWNLRRKLMKKHQPKYVETSITRMRDETRSFWCVIHHGNLPVNWRTRMYLTG